MPLTDSYVNEENVKVIVQDAAGNPVSGSNPFPVVVSNATIDPGRVSFADDLAVTISRTNYEIFQTKKLFPGISNQAVTDDAINYVFINESNAAEILTTGYPTTGSHIRLARVFTTGSVITQIVDDRPFFTTASGSMDLGGVKGVELVTPVSKSLQTTISGALSLAASGDVVIVGPGNYTESPFTVPSGVVLRAAEGENLTTLTPSSSTGTFMTLEKDTVVDAFKVVCPSDEKASVFFSGAAGTSANISRLSFIGNGASGVGVHLAGPGMLFARDTFFVSGVLGTVFSASSPGTLDVNHLVARSGTVGKIFDLDGAGSALLDNVSIVSPVSATSGVVVRDFEVKAHNLDFGSQDVGIHITDDSATVRLRGCRLDSNIRDIKINEGITLATLNVMMTELTETKVTASGDWLASGSHIFSFQDINTEDKGMKLYSELSVGHPARGSEAVFGEGDSFFKNMHVLTTDGTATTGSDGGNITSVSSNARSPAGSTFSFQGVSAGHTILFGADVKTATDFLKHWGIKIKVSGAAEQIASQSFAFDVWDGSEWTEIGAMSTHANLFYRYANNHFIREDSFEHVRFGVEESSAWERKTIDNKDFYWSRVRISKSLTTAPVFEQAKLSTNRFEINPDGTNTFHGRSRFKSNLGAFGNIFGEQGGIASHVIDIGPTGTFGPPGTWPHHIKNSNINGNGEAVLTQYTLPHGIDTSFPLKFRVTYLADKNVGNDVVLQLSSRPIGVKGIEVADPAGGITPITRSLADADEISSGSAPFATKTVNIPTLTKAFSLEFGENGEFPIDKYYEDDIVFVRLELDNDGPSNVNFIVLNLSIEGVIWTHGAKL